MKKLGEVQITSKDAERRAWKEELHSKTDGRGLQYHDGFGDGWLTEPESEDIRQGGCEEVREEVREGGGVAC